MGPVFERAKKSFYVLRCVGDKNIKSQCAVHNTLHSLILCTESPFGDVPQTNFPFLILKSICIEVGRRSSYVISNIDLYFCQSDASTTPIDGLSSS